MRNATKQAITKSFTQFRDLVATGEASFLQLGAALTEAVKSVKVIMAPDDDFFSGLVIEAAAYYSVFEDDASKDMDWHRSRYVQNRCFDLVGSVTWLEGDLRDWEMKRDAIVSMVEDGDVSLAGDLPKAMAIISQKQVALAHLRPQRDATLHLHRIVTGKNYVKPSRATGKDTSWKGDAKEAAALVAEAKAQAAAK